MARGRSLVSILVVVVMSALPVTMTRAFAKHGHPGASSADEAQVRELLSKLAAASGVPEPEERTDADLMYEAMLRWNGEPAGSAAVDRLIDSSKKEAARSKPVTTTKVRKMFWKDPFADDPQKLVLIRQEDRDLIDQYQRRTRRSDRPEARAAREAAGHARDGAHAPATTSWPRRAPMQKRRGPRASASACVPTRRRTAASPTRRPAANRASGGARAPARSTAAMSSGPRIALASTAPAESSPHRRRRFPCPRRPSLRTASSSRLCRHRRRRRRPPVEARRHGRSH